MLALEYPVSAPEEQHPCFVPSSVSAFHPRGSIFSNQNGLILVNRSIGRSRQRPAEGKFWEAGTSCPADRQRSTLFRAE